MTPDFIVERLEIIAGSAHERESGNETIRRMVKYLSCHKEGNEDAIREALHHWASDRENPKYDWATIILKELAL